MRMNLRDQILKEHTKDNCEKIVSWVGDDQSRFNALFKLFLNNESRVTQRAASLVIYCVMNHPKFMKNNFEKLITKLKKSGIHNSIKRNSVRLFQAIDIPEKHEGEIMELCFANVESPTETVSVKAFSLMILVKLAKKFQETIPEIKILIEDQFIHQTAGFKSRSKKLLKQFE